MGRPGVGENCFPVKTWKPELSTGSSNHVTRFDSMWLRVQFQFNAIHLMYSIGNVMLFPYLHAVKTSPQKSRPVYSGDWKQRVKLWSIITR